MGGIYAAAAHAEPPDRPHRNFARVSCKTLGGGCRGCGGGMDNAPLLVASTSPIPLACLVLLPYGTVYLGITALLGVGETQYLLRRLRSR